MRLRVFIGVGSLILFVVLAVTVNPLFWSMFGGDCLPWVQAAWQRRRRAAR